MYRKGFGDQNVAGVPGLDCHHCIGHSLLCEMTVISLLPNLAESISPVIREEGTREGGGEGEAGEEKRDGRDRTERRV